MENGIESNTESTIPGGYAVENGIETDSNSNDDNVENIVNSPMEDNGLEGNSTALVLERIKNKKKIIFTNEFIFFIAGLVATILKHGTIFLILGWEFFFIKMNLKNYEKYANEVILNKFSISKFDKSLVSLKVVFITSMFLLCFSVLSFVFFAKLAKKIKLVNFSTFPYNLCIMFILELLLESFNQFLKVRTQIDRIETLFSFSTNTFSNYFMRYSFIYLFNSIFVHFNIYILTIEWLLSLLTTIKPREYDHVKGQLLTESIAINEEIKLKIFDLLKQFNIKNENVLIVTNLMEASFKDFYRREITKICTGYAVDSELGFFGNILYENVFIPNFVLKNYKEKGLIGHLALFFETWKYQMDLLYLATILDGVIFFVLVLLIRISYTSKHPYLGMISSIRICNLLEFYSILLINYIQRKNELTADLTLKKKGYLEELIECFHQKAKIENQSQNVHFSNVLALISPYNSLVSRMNNLATN